MLKYNALCNIIIDPKLVDQLLSPSLLRFLRTGRALSFDDDLDNDFEVLIISTTTIVKIHDQVSRGKYGLSVDADVGLWLRRGN